MPDQLKHYLDNASRRAVRARDIMNDAPAQFLADVVVDLCAIVKQLVDRLPAEVETAGPSLADIDERAIVEWRNSLWRMRQEIDALIGEAERFRINYSKRKEASDQ